jgi:hypothetical protein
MDRIFREALEIELHPYNIKKEGWFLVTASVVPSSPILVTLMKEALSFSETSSLKFSL